jgi:hypothetical protein
MSARCLLKIESAQIASGINWRSSPDRVSQRNENADFPIAHAANAFARESCWKHSQIGKTDFCFSSPKRSSRVPASQANTQAISKERKRMKQKSDLRKCERTRSDQLRRQRCRCGRIGNPIKLMYARCGRVRGYSCDKRKVAVGWLSASRA